MSAVAALGLTSAAPATADALAPIGLVELLRARANTFMVGDADARALEALQAGTSLERDVETPRDPSDIASAVVRNAERVAESTFVRFQVYMPVKGPADVERIMRRYGFSDEELAELNPGVDFETIPVGSRILIYRFDQEAPGSSVGRANYGSLRGGMPMVEGDYWRVRFPDESWGTPYAVSSIARGLTHVGERRPMTRPILIGDLSYRNGGHMRPHRSHRSGRDADITYYSHSGIGAQQFWHAAHSSDLDVPAQWELFKYWIELDVVSYIFVDRAIQGALYEYALSVEEDPEFVKSVFQYPSGRRGAVIRHVRGHADHLHVRFKCAEYDMSCRRL